MASTEAQPVFARTITCLSNRVGQHDVGKSLSWHLRKGTQFLRYHGRDEASFGNFNRHGIYRAGAILHQGSMVLGVTTAATLWFTTLMGFCFGAGEHGLGMRPAWVGCLLCYGAWSGLKSAGSDLQQATLIVMISREGPSRGDRSRCGVERPQAFRVGSELFRRRGRSALDVYWRASQQDTELPNYIAELARRSGVRSSTGLRQRGLKQMAEINCARAGSPKHF